MNWTTDANVISIIEKTLNGVDARLIDHGKRVAYKVFQILNHIPGIDKTQIRDICVIALLHDIGAYKTEDINKLLAFETKNIWDHSIYGYLFAKCFSPLPSMSPLILFHHCGIRELRRIQAPYTTLAQIIFMADRMDILSQVDHLNSEQVAKRLLKSSESQFDEGLVRLVLENNLHMENEPDGQREAFEQLLYHTQWLEEDVRAYLKMIIFSIDFRSPQTVTHTVTTTSVCESLAELFAIRAKERDALQMGAWLHDIGKTGIPTEILEKPGKLTAEELTVVRKHILLTDEILQGNIDDKIRLIASRHHEKLDGSGYPYGLQADSLTLLERMAAVADIFSALHGERSYKEAFPKDRVFGVLYQMKNDGLLDKELIDALDQHYDEIVGKAKKDAEPILSLYQEIRNEYKLIKENVDGGDFACLAKFI